MTFSTIGFVMSAANLIVVLSLDGWHWGGAAPGWFFATFGWLVASRLGAMLTRERANG